MRLGKFEIGVIPLVVIAGIVYYVIDAIVKIQGCG